MKELTKKSMLVALRGGLKMIMADKSVPPNIKRLMDNFGGVDPDSVEFSERGETHLSLVPMDTEGMPMPHAGNAMNVRSGSAYTMTFLDKDGKMRMIVLM